MELGLFCIWAIPLGRPFPQRTFGEDKSVPGLLLLRAAESGRGDQAYPPRASAAPPRLDGTYAVSDSAEPFRSAATQGSAVVLEGRLFVKELSDKAIDTHLEHARQTPSELSPMHLYPIDGAVHNVGRSETAWNCRDATWSMVIAGIDADPRPRHLRPGLRDTGKPCIRITLEAPTSTS